MTEEIAKTEDFTEDQLTDLLQQGDLSSLAPALRNRFLFRLAQHLHLNPFSRPFDLIHVRKPDGSKKLIVYANKSASDQIANDENLNVEVLYDGLLPLSPEVYDDTTYCVKAKVSNPDGRFRQEIGCVTLAGTSGEDRANAPMKCYTKASRRGILSFKGLGMPDESEVSSIPGVVQSGGEGKPKVVPAPAVLDVKAQPLPRASSTSKPPVKVRP